MGSALTSCAGADTVRATGKRRRRHSGAPCLTPPPSTLPQPSQLSKPAAACGGGKSQQLLHLQPLKGMAPDLLPHDVIMWSSNSSRRSASAGERSGTPSPAPPSPRVRSSRQEASNYAAGGSRADVRALPTTATDSPPTVDARRSEHRALFSSTGAMAGSTAFVGQLAPSAGTAARSTVDLVRDIGDGCVPPTSSAAAAAASRQRHRGCGGDDVVQCHGSSEVSAPAYSRGSVRFRIVSQPRPVSGGAAASRLCRSASEALSIACRWPSAAGSAAAAEAAVASAAGSGAEQCAIRPATGDFTNWTVVGKRTSGKASVQTEAKTAETTAIVRLADAHVERTSVEAPESPLPSLTSLGAATGAAEASRSLSAAGDNHFDDNDDPGCCRSATGQSLKAEKCEAEAAAAAEAPSDVRQQASEQPTSLSRQPTLYQLPAVDENRASRSGSGCSSVGSSSSDSSSSMNRSDAVANLQSPPPAPSGGEPPSHGGRPTLLAHALRTFVGGSGSGDDGSSSRSPSWLLNSPPSPSGSVWSSSGKPRQPPPKPPRTYSYRASMQPKRISRTTEEFVAMWDELRRSLLASEPVDDAGSSGGGNDDEDEQDSGIYMNHYAARARGWQILTLAQEVLALRLDAPAAVDGLERLGHVDAGRRSALLEAAPRGGRDLADALIDVMLEKGDACFDAFRAFLRGYDGEGGGSQQIDLAQLLDTLDDVLSIGVAASGRNFALTTKQCAVTCGGGGGASDDGIGIGRRWRSLIGDRGAAAAASLDSGDDYSGGDCGLDDTASVGRRGCDVEDDDGPTCALDLYDQRFGDASCERLAATIRALNRVSSLRLAKNGITAAGAHALSTALAAPAAEGAVGRLTHLDLRLNAIGNCGLASIAEALRSTACSLEVLVLSHAGLTTGCGRLLADALVANRRFGEAGPEEYGAVTDREVLAAGREKQLRLLRVLDLSHNEADDGDCDALADALGGGGGAPLRRLNLRGNSFGGRGCARLCSAIAGGRGGGCRLACLDLSRNRVLDDGARALAAALASPSCRLRELYAEGCGVTAAGCAALCVALTTGRSAGADAAPPPPRSLSSLSLSNNPIADEGLRCLSEALLAAGADGDGYEDYDYCDDDSGDAGGGLRTLRVDQCGGSPEAVGDLLRAVRLRNSSLEALSARRRTFDRCSAASCCSLRSPPPVVTSGGGDVYVGRQNVTASVDAQAQPGRSSQGGLERSRRGTET